MTKYTDIGVEKHKHVGLIEIRKPPLNFFDVSLINQIADALEEFDKDIEIRASVLAASGKAFCAGADFANRPQTGAALADLVGGIESVTLSDEEARRRGTQKTVLERRAPPTFDVLIEIQDRQKLVVHPDAGTAATEFPAQHLVQLVRERRYPALAGAKRRLVVGMSVADEEVVACNAHIRLS